MRFESGLGIPGRVLETKKSVWIENLGEGAVFERTEQALYLQVTGGTGFPIAVSGKVIAIAEFFVPELRPYDRQFIRLAETAALQLGSALQKNRNEAQIKKNYVELKRIHSELENAQTPTRAIRKIGLSRSDGRRRCARNQQPHQLRKQ